MCNADLTFSPICRTCLHSLRHSSTSVSSQQTPSDNAPPPSIPLPTHPVTTSHATPSPPQTIPTPPYTILASLLLSRPPLLTKTLHPFETALHLYNRRLNERLALPFTRYFYYPKGTSLLTSFRQRVAKRKTPARDIGVYDAYGDEAWDDEVRVGSKDGDAEWVREQLLREADAEEKEKERGMAGAMNAAAAKPQEEVFSSSEPEENDVHSSKADSGQEGKQIGGTRLMPADFSNDTHSLDRKADRTLYLVLNNRSADGIGNGNGKSKSKWDFPRSPLHRGESLHTAAERLIVETGGVNMNTWVVGNWPVGHQVHTYVKPKSSSTTAAARAAATDEAPPSPLPPIPSSSSQQSPQSSRSSDPILGSKTFFMKARIAAGQVDLSSVAASSKPGTGSSASSRSSPSPTDFQWLCREELEGVLSHGDWSAVRGCLAER